MDVYVTPDRAEADWGGEWFVQIPLNDYAIAPATPNLVVMHRECVTEMMSHYGPVPATIVCIVTRIVGLGLGVFAGDVVEFPVRCTVEYVLPIFLHTVVVVYTMTVSRSVAGIVVRKVQG